MKALRIPRTDHDVYCIDITGINGKSKQQTHIEEQLLLLHPVYGTHTAMDIKKLKHKEHEWAIVTVMQKEILEEYRILYPHTAFVTATSLAIFAKDFFTQDAYECGCERIWFDAQRQLIISEEAEIAAYGMAGDNTDGRKDELSTADRAGEQAGNPQEREEPVFRAGRRSIVFARKQNIRKAAGIGIGIMLAVAVTAYTAWRAVYPPRQEPVQPEQETAVEINAENMPAVTPIGFLAVIAEHVPAMQAVLERYRYTDADGVLCTFRSSSLENSITAFQTIPHRTGCAIKEITQKDKETVVTVQTEPDILQTVYTSAAEPAAIAGFTDTLKAEILKTGTAKIPQIEQNEQKTHKEQRAMNVQNMQITMNGSSIVLSALVKTVVIDTFLYGIDAVMNRYAFDAAVLEVAAVEEGLLSLYIEFQQIETGSRKTQRTAVHTAAYPSPVIAYAFGYVKPSQKIPVPIQTGENRAAKQSAAPVPAIPEGSVEIGKIKTGGKIKTYYRTPDGRIINTDSDS